jgi:hypothetical protein
MKSFADFYRQVSKDRLLKEDMEINNQSMQGPITQIPNNSGSGMKSGYSFTGTNTSNKSSTTNASPLEINQPNNQPAGSSVSGYGKAPTDPQYLEILKKMMNDGTDLGNFWSQLNKYISNPKFQATIKSGDENDKLSVTSANVSIRSVFPTQAEVFLENSVDAGIKDQYGSTPDMLKGTNPNAAGAIIVSKVGNKYHIIDGHHRWSQFCCFNPDQQISAKIISGLPSALKSLKAVHLAIAAEKGSVPSEGGDPKKNLFSLSEEEVAQHVLQLLGDENTQTATMERDKENKPVKGSLVKNQKPILKMFRDNIPEEKLPNAKTASAQDIANYIANNAMIVKELKKGADQANTRTTMPQTGGTNFDVMLSTGDVNINPDGTTAMSTNLTQGSKVERRFHPGLNMNEQLLVLSGVLTIEQAEDNLKRRKRR